MQIHKLFHHAQIVGRRFPICMVNIKGSVIEVAMHFYIHVSSFTYEFGFS